MNRQDLEIQHANETIDLLRPVAYFFAFLYFSLTLAHFFLLQETFKWILCTAALLTAIVSVVIALNISKISSARHSLIILLLVLTASSNSLLTLMVFSSSRTNHQHIRNYYRVRHCAIKSHPLDSLNSVQLDRMGHRQLHT